MTDLQLFTKLSALPPALKAEVNDFVDFLLSKKQRPSAAQKPKFGCAKGQFKMAPDFDEPLEDFQEYMK